MFRGDHVNGEARHRHGRVHPGAHQQHLPAQLRGRGQRPPPRAHRPRRRARARLPEGDITCSFMTHHLLFYDTTCSFMTTPAFL